ncbi:hypothetical protein [Aureimonas jatrophae]|uniref:Cell Wall Hydrolase n=1 Tax=Aureimonas jatrophae TaxID=1166073 RepID=A0A1H0FRR2_9HYPH|nr:hypothetical protein [Aureimonas jatrophae]MBB3950481.1 hypothetical protein [Aureimonas jatrophae]SDN97325.1 hypothetical protein SAMN05192530_102643 [Aureimonas jatrophae]
MTARSVIDVMLGEGVSGTRQARYDDFLGIASVIANRAALTGQTPQDVVGVRREFNAYGKALPKGVNAYRDLAEQAWREVQEKGPIHRGTFYATPSATRNLPKGLSKVAATTGHQYFTDPKNRAIGTARGYARVDPSRLQAPTTATAYAAAPQQTGAQRAIRGGLLGSNVPTPTAAPRGGLLADYQPSPRGGRVTGMVPTPTPAPRELVPGVANGVASARAAPDPSRFGGHMPMQAPRSMLDRYAETQPGLKGSRVAPQSVTAGLAPTPQEEANLRDRLGPMEPARQWGPSVADRYNRPAPAAPSVSARAGLLGVTPAAAATMPTSTATGPAPVSSGFAGRVGSPRSLERPSLEGLLGASKVSPTTSPLSPAGGLPDRVPAPTFAQRPEPITVSRTVGPAPRVAAVPDRVAIATPTARPAQPTQPTSYAPQTAPTATYNEPAQPASKSWGQRAAVVAGSLLGGAVAGPVGGLLGGAIANGAINRGLIGPSPQSRAGNGYANSLPDRPNAPTARERADLDRSLASRSRENGPSISKSTRDAIGKAEKSGKGGFW